MSYNHKNIEKWNNYHEIRQRFDREINGLNHNFEKNTLSGHIKSPNIEIISKIDEIKALEAAKEREEQGRAVELRKKIEQNIAEKEMAYAWNKQIQEKKRNHSLLKLENNSYAQELEEKYKYTKFMERQEQEKRNSIRNNYSQALIDQMLQKKREKSMLLQLENETKKIFTPDFLSEGQPSSNFTKSSVRSDSVTIGDRNHSPLKFLMQYGNYIVGNGKK